jgi:hypothetical protein
MDVSGADGLNDNPLLAPVLESDNPPLPLGGVPGKTRDLSKKWLLQEDGSYLPVFSEKSAHPFVSSMIPISNDKPVDSRPGVFQTWGIIATLIKQQDQAECSTTVARQRTVDNGQDAVENNHDTISAFIDNNEEIMSEENSQDDDFDDTLDTEHDVFNDFINQGDDPNTDLLDLIMIQGSPELRSRIRALLEEYRSVFATTLSTDPATILPFELEVNLEKWEVA